MKNCTIFAHFTKDQNSNLKLLVLSFNNEAIARCHMKISMFKYLNNSSSLSRNGCLRGGGGLNFLTAKIKIFIFSCIEVINVTIVALLKHGSAVLNGINIS